jgi:hypothetical protein
LRPCAAVEDAVTAAAADDEAAGGDGVGRR